MHVYDPRQARRGWLTNFFTTCGLFSPDTTLICHCHWCYSFVLFHCRWCSVYWTENIERYDGSKSQWMHIPSAKPLAARLEIEVNGEKVSVNPQLLFQRLCVATSTKRDEARQQSFAYELCSCPPALFDHKLYDLIGKKNSWRSGALLPWKILLYRQLVLSRLAKESWLAGYKAGYVCPKTIDQLYWT